MIGTDKQVIAALKEQRNQLADDCAELKAAWDASQRRIAELERQLTVANLRASVHPVPEDGGFWTPPAQDEHGVSAP